MTENLERYKMKKIILSETQAQNLVTKFVSEQVPATRETEYTIDDGRYRIKCEFHFDYNNELVTYKGGEIDNINHGIAEVSYMIHVKDESFGITGIDVNDIRGPKEIQTQIRYYPEGASSEDEDWWKKRVEENVNIPLDWGKIEIDDSGFRMNYIGVGKRIDVELYPDGRGGLIGKKIDVIVKKLNISDED
jgi:hypothetical protein